tara:strand:- start:47 stop:805 length:759 start_codon:yes stop_codon:yes gene_type:complete
MQVIDILTETKKNKVDEGPIRLLKRTLGKNTAMGKAAQLDVELDKEVKNIYKDYYAVTKQDPKKQGMTAKGLAQFLVAKGFASKPSEVMGFINAEPSMGRTAKKAGKKIAKGAKATAGAAKSGASAVVGAAKKVKDKLKPKASGLTPDQPNLPGIESLYKESHVVEADAQISSGQAKKVIKRFVQKGFQKQMPDRLSKSAYGDAEPEMNPKAKSAVDNAKAMASVPKDVQGALSVLKKAGYTIDSKKKTVSV